MLASINEEGGQPRMQYVGFNKRGRRTAQDAVYLASINEEGGQPRMQYVGFNKRGRRTAQDAVCWLQ